jgi:hypothetical protein
VTTETKMSSGEALADIRARVMAIEDQLSRFEELASLIVDQVQEVAASGLGNMLGGLVGGSNGDSEHSSDSG